LITCNPRKIHELERRMTSEGIPFAIIGKVKKGRGLRLRDEFGRSSRFEPRPDKYWSVYERAMKRGLC